MSVKIAKLNPRQLQKVFDSFRKTNSVSKTSEMTGVTMPVITRILQGVKYKNFQDKNRPRFSLQQIKSMQKQFHANKGTMRFSPRQFAGKYGLSVYELKELLGISDVDIYREDTKSTKEMSNLQNKNWLKASSGILRIANKLDESGNYELSDKLMNLINKILE